MTNENNNINELVADDDPTVELETPTFSGDDDFVLEADAKTFDSEENTDGPSTSDIAVSELQSDLALREKTISGLQYDIEQLHARWLGLEAEIGARDEQTGQLHTEVASLREGMTRKEKLIKTRDGKIKALKLEIRQRDKDFRELQSRYDDLQILPSEEPLPDEPKNADSVRIVDEHSANDLQQRLDRSEEYADAMRQQTQDVIGLNAQHERAIENLTRSLADARKDNRDMDSELTETVESLTELQTAFDTVQSRHEEEIRTLRFELGEAQNTIVETGDINNQLASDLVDARGFKEELEVMLEDSEEQSSGHIEKLQREVKKLSGKAESLEQKLVTKSEAISVLLDELTKKSEHIESVDVVEDIVLEIDEPIPERSPGADENDARKSADRVTRVLIGTVDGQVLRFPLFKDRLTIGRTKDNDIQLAAAYVSRKHAVIHTDAEKTRVIDWGSKNGIKVNSATVSEHFLQHGDILVIGNAKFRYEERRKRDS